MEMALKGGEIEMTMMRKILKSKEGFTLIELMIVLLVLGVLATIAVPRFADMTGKANLVKAKTELKQVQTALELYNAEHGAYPSVDANDAAFKAVLADYLTDGDLSDYTFTYTAPAGGKGYSVAAANGKVTLTISRTDIK